MKNKPPLINTAPADDVERRMRESFRGGYLVNMKQAPCPLCTATLQRHPSLPATQDRPAQTAFLACPRCEYAVAVGGR